jgi:hypothetical protein
LFAFLYKFYKYKIKKNFFKLIFFILIFLFEIFIFLNFFCYIKIQKKLMLCSAGSTGPVNSPLGEVNNNNCISPRALVPAASAEGGGGGGDGQRRCGGGGATAVGANWCGIFYGIKNLHIFMASKICTFLWHQKFAHFYGIKKL